MRLRFFVIVLALLVARISRADGVGTSVGGSLRVGSATANVFNPVNGDVPVGYGNSTLNPPVVSIGSGIEFAAQSSTDFYTADFTGSTLEITDNASSSPTNLNFLFIDPAFASFSLVGAASGVTYSLNGDALTVNVNYQGSTTPGKYVLDFTYTTVGATPEPSGVVLLGTGGLAMGGILRRKVLQRARG